MKFPHAAKGVKKIYASEILFLIAYILSGGVTILASVFMASTAVNNEGGMFASAFGTFGFLGAGMVFSLIGSILCVVGYFQAAKDENGFKRAIICTVFSIIAAIAATFFQNQTGALGWLYTALTALVQIFKLCASYFSIDGLRNLSAECGRQDMVRKGTNILRLIVTIYMISFLVTILTRVFKENTFNTVLANVFSVLSIVLIVIQYFLYLRYLRKSGKMLKKS